MSKKKNVSRETEQLLVLGKAFKTRRLIDLAMESKDFQEKSGVSSMTFIKLENGELENISLVTLNKIADALGMEITLTATVKK